MPGWKLSSSSLNFSTWKLTVSNFLAFLFADS
jgi:hypothetical protein